jgi:hemerythrin
MFGLAVLILALITAAILGLVVSPTNPLSWLLVASLAFIPLIHRRLKARQYLPWKAEYNLGIDSIDSQHRKLVDLINSLQTAIDYSTGERFEREALDALVDYTRIHFEYEEDLMEQHDYPELIPHRAEHERMIAKVEELMESYLDDQDNALQDANAFLKDWLINHINGTDKQYSQFLIDKGVI